MKFSQRLYENVKPIWQKNHDHPFVQGIGDGTLDKEKFRFFMIQDYLYLIEYAKLFAIGSMKAKDVKTMGEFAKLLDSTLNMEMALHRQYAKEFGISEEELESAEPAPTTLAYTHYMLHVGNNGGLAELVASLLPCMWSYAEIGKALDERPGARDHDYYGEWIKMYSGEEFHELTDWTIHLLDQLAEGKPEHELQHLEEIFLNTTRFEYMFWDMSYHQKTWPGE
ncbi:thiaminase II [Alteribacter populi]|uniref:thiaminase II n=1 Tax=Alteribacter populi TaxID=2011011 RepID=UPI000BBB1575|nr:thiaminase II [Alteribacter populi]